MYPYSIDIGLYDDTVESMSKRGRDATRRRQSGGNKGSTSAPTTPRTSTTTNAHIVPPLALKGLLVDARDALRSAPSASSELSAFSVDEHDDASAAAAVVDAAGDTAAAASNTDACISTEKCIPLTHDDYVSMFCYPCRSERRHLRANGQESPRTEDDSERYAAATAKLDIVTATVKLRHLFRSRLINPASGGNDDYIPLRKRYVRLVRRAAPLPLASSSSSSSVRINKQQLGPVAEVLLEVNEERMRFRNVRTLRTRGDNPDRSPPPF
jgi:hypothetical protein